MTTEPLAHELGAKPSAGVECPVVIGPTWHLAVGTERAKADQLVSRKQGMETRLGLKQPVRVCICHVVALVGRGIAPRADVQCVFSRQWGDMHGEEGPSR